MVSTTLSTLVEKVIKPRKKGCKPSHENQRAKIGGGYLLCEVCGEEISN